MQNQIKNQTTRIKSNLKGGYYYASEVCRIVNPKQCMLYIKHGLYPLDIYTSIDSKTGNDITVMIFDKVKSQPLYEAWCDHTLE